ncbi:MAG: glycosyltransferase family 2 protein [Eubacteriales bacterium]|nr:glycosyltransferase family 2 protein [Eubacteriales bacterium]
MKYSVVIPAYNEQEVLHLSYSRLKKAMEGLGDYELIFVNDGSRDDTLKVLKEIAAEDKTVKVISFSRNFGHQEAVSAGMAKAQGGAVVIIDCDLQDPPEVIPGMVEKWKNGADIVYGQRIKRKGETVFKKLTAWAYYRVLKMLGGQYIPANTGDFRLIDKKVCETLVAMPEKNRFLRGMAAWSGFKAEPLEYVRDERAAGQTKYSMKKMMKLAGDGITSFSNRPLKAPLYFGMALLMLSLAYLVLSVIFVCVAVWTYQHILFAAVFCLISVILISLGIFGLYLGRIYDEAKARPIYIIDEEINMEGI